MHTPRIELSCVRSSKIILAHAFPLGYLSVLWVGPSGMLTFLSAPYTRPYSPNTKFMSVLLPAYGRILRISVRFGTRHLSHMSGVLLRYVVQHFLTCDLIWALLNFSRTFLIDHGYFRHWAPFYRCHSPL